MCVIFIVNVKKCNLRCNSDLRKSVSTCLSRVTYVFSLPKLDIKFTMVQKDGIGRMKEEYEEGNAHALQPQGMALQSGRSNSKN